MKNSMKSIKFLFLCSIIIVGMSWLQSVDVKAEASNDVEVEYFDDGSYMVTTFEDVEFDTDEEVTLLSTYKTVSKSKSSTYYTASGVAQWKFTIAGTFQYNGTTSSAKSASSSVTIYNSQWSVKSRNAYTSGNSVKGDIACTKKNLIIIPVTISRSLTLTCSKDGVFS